MTDKNFSKLIDQVDSIISAAQATGNRTGNIQPLVRLNRCQKLTMAQRDLVIERNWTAGIGRAQSIGNGLTTNTAKPTLAPPSAGLPR